MMHTYVQLPVQETYAPDLQILFKPGTMSLSVCVGQMVLTVGTYFCRLRVGVNIVIQGGAETKRRLVANDVFGCGCVMGFLACGSFLFKCRLSPLADDGNSIANLLLDQVDVECSTPATRRASLTCR